MNFCSDIVVRAPKHPRDAPNLWPQKTSSPWEAPKFQLCQQKSQPGSKNRWKNAVFGQKVVSGSVLGSVLHRFCVPLPFRIDFVHEKTWFSHYLCDIFQRKKLQVKRNLHYFHEGSKPWKSSFFLRKTMIFKKSRLFVLNNFDQFGLKKSSKIRC